jgi:hypothetical protein
LLASNRQRPPRLSEVLALVLPRDPPSKPVPLFGSFILPLSIPFKAFGNTVKACRGPYPIEAKGLGILAVGFCQVTLLLASIEWQAHCYTSAVVDPNFKSFFNSRAACDLENLTNGCRRSWLVRLPNSRRQDLSDFLIANFAPPNFGKQLSRLLHPCLKGHSVDQTIIIGARNMSPFAQDVHMHE